MRRWRIWQRWRWRRRMEEGGMIWQRRRMAII
jgi:hypothetical protein